MVCRRVIQVTGLVAALVMIAGAAPASEAKYPDWKGAWERWYPPNWVLGPNGNRTASGQPSFERPAAAFRRPVGF